MSIFLCLYIIGTTGASFIDHKTINDYQKPKALIETKHFTEKKVSNYKNIFTNNNYYSRI